MSSSRTATKSLLQSAAGDVDWNEDGVATLSFDDPHDINAGGTAFLHGGDSGVVRLELSLPAERAAQVIEFVRGLRPILRGGTAYIEASAAPTTFMGQDELANLIAEQAADAASDGE